jgi:hypothetical protein
MKISISLTTGSRQVLYHFTSLIGLEGILHNGAIGAVDEEAWKATERFHKLRKGWVSFTRNKRYRYVRSKKDAACLVFDWDELKRHGYRVSPYSYPFPISGDDWTRDHSKRRDESEERVLGPVYLKHGCIAIYISPETHEEIKRVIRLIDSQIDDNNKLHKYIETDNWCEEALRLRLDPNYQEGTFQRLMERNGPDWRPKWWKTSTMDASNTERAKFRKEFEDLLTKVKIGLP